VTRISRRKRSASDRSLPSMRLTATDRMSQRSKAARIVPMPPRAITGPRT